MATVTKWTPFGVALDITATGGTVTRTSATKYTVVINASWETYYNGASTNYGMSATSGGVTKTISSFGTNRSSGSGSFTGTYSISGNGAATKSVSVTFKNFNSDNGDSATKAVSFNVSVPAWTSYTIKYNMNGGSGSIANQTKWKDQTLTLSSTKPTRTGYDFLGWATSSTATSATYSAGGKYTANAAATLYAVWKAKTYTVSFNANGGSGAPSSQTKTYGKTLTLSSTKPTRAGYTFKGWATSASATSATYSAGGSYTANATATLYAVWAVSYVKPKISSYSVERVGDEVGGSTNAKVSFKWETFNAVSSITVYFWNATESESDAWSETIPASGTSGTVNYELQTVVFSVDSSYIFKVVVADSGGDASLQKTLSSQSFPIEVLAKGLGISFGKAAELEGYLDCYFKAKFHQSIEMINNHKIWAPDPTGLLKDCLNPQNYNGNTVLGYGNYETAIDRKEAGEEVAGSLTNVYGYDVHIGVANTDNPGTYRPYFRKGDSLSFTLRTAGYVTNSKKDVSFLVPLSKPIIGAPTITAASNSGFVLRQGDKYTHGSSASVSVTPSSYSVTHIEGVGLVITAVFSGTTNVTNNDAIGVYWSGQITFS